MIDKQVPFFELVTQYMNSLNPSEKKVMGAFIQTLRADHKEYLLLKELFGFRLVELTEKSIIASVPVQPIIFNGMGMVSGGVLAALADTTMGELAAQIVNENQFAVTMDLSINFIAPGQGERLNISAKTIHIGKETLVMDCEIVNEQKNLIARAVATFFILSQEH